MRVWRRSGIGLTVAALVAGALVALIPPTQAVAGPQRAAVEDPTPAVIPAAIWRAYRQAIIDSTTATPAEVVDDLLVPARSDPRTEWKSIDGEDYLLVGLLRYEPFAGVKVGDKFALSSDRWVSIPRQLGQACAEYRCRTLDDQGLDQTLKHIVGLPPDADYRYILHFWVMPADLFRPCTDPRVASTSCPEQVTAGTTAAPAPTVVGTTNVASFLWTQANYAWRMPTHFRPKVAVSCAKVWTTENCYGFPWTRLGYTYDWTPGAKDDVGVSEFIAVNGATAYLEAVGSQRDFFPRR